MKCTNEKMTWNTQDKNLSWYVPKANVDHTISNQWIAISTLDHSATTPSALNINIVWHWRADETFYVTYHVCIIVKYTSGTTSGCRTSSYRSWQPQSLLAWRLSLRCNTLGWRIRTVRDCSICRVWGGVCRSGEGSIFLTKNRVGGGGSLNFPITFEDGQKLFIQIWHFYNKVYGLYYVCY